LIAAVAPAILVGAWLHGSARRRRSTGAAERKIV